MSQILEAIQSLTKALEAGQITSAPGTLVQGSALQIREQEDVMHVVTFQDKHIKLQKMFPVKKARNMLVIFKRQLSYGDWGGSAQLEGAVGQDETGDYVEAVVPMCFYSHLRRVTLAANMVEAFDGVKAEDRESQNAALKIAADVEFDCFQGKAHFSNAGVFDGNPAATAVMPNLPGLDLQIRQSDVLTNTQDLMFAEFGSSESVVINCGGAALGQTRIEDAALRARLNFAEDFKLHLDPVALSGYNKIVIQTGTNINQYATMGSALTSSGADLRSQSVSEGSVKLESSHFLRGKYRPQRARATSPGAPSIAFNASPTVTIPSGVIAAGTYVYIATAVNDRGESVASASISQALSGTQGSRIDITAPASPASVRFYNVYRSDAGGSAASAKFIGRVKYDGSATTLFIDLGNKSPAFTNAYLLQSDCGALHELAPYSQAKMAIQDLSMASAHYRFLTLSVYKPRMNVILDNLKGTF